MIAAGWRTFDDLVEAHKAIFSGDPTSMESGSSQIHAWKLKNQIPSWMELTMTLAHAIATIDRDGLEIITHQKEFMNNECQFLFADPDAEFDALFAKDDLTKDEALRFANLTLQKLDTLKWQKEIHINSEGETQQPSGTPQDSSKMKGFQNPEPRQQQPPTQTEAPRTQGMWQLGANLGKAPDPNAPSFWERQKQNRHPQQQNRRPQRPQPREVEAGNYHVPSYHKVTPKPEPPKFDENVKAIAPPVSAGKGVEGQTQFKISPALLAQKK